jgi:hypothetical protein
MNSATPSQLLADYQALRNRPAGSDLPSMQAAGIEQHRQHHAQPAAIWSALCTHAPRQGWLQFQSHQLSFHDGLPSPPPEWGALLQAEAVTTDGLSLSVHRHPQEGWVLTASRHLETGEQLCDIVRHLAHADSGALKYRRYWQLDPKLGAVQTASCFIGFEQKNSQGA